MNRLWAPFSLVILAGLALACGSGNGRQLQSITISQTANGEQLLLVATGTFSKPPITVTPLPVFWSFGLIAPPPPTYDLSTQPYVLDCTGSPTFPSPAAALAPTNPNAPISGPWSSVKMVTGSAPVTCPQN